MYNFVFGKLLLCLKTNRVLLIHASCFISYQNSSLCIQRTFQHTLLFVTFQKMYNRRSLLVLILLLPRLFLLFTFFLVNFCFHRHRLPPSPPSGPLRRRWQQQQRPVHLHPQLASPFLSALNEASRPRAAVPSRHLHLLPWLLNLLPPHLVVLLLVSEKTAAGSEKQIRRRH